MRNCSLSVSICLLFFACAMAAAGKKQEDTKNWEIRVVKKAIPSKTVYQFSREVGRGRLIKARSGKPGSVKLTYRVILKDGKAVGKELIKEERSEPTNTLYLMGRDGYPSSRGSYSRGKVLTMHASAYTNSIYENSGTGLTAMGLPAGYGHVAVDPRVIPLGTRLFIEGYGFAIASDTGGAIKGNRIDLCIGGSRAAAFRFGRRTVKVHILKGR